MTGAIFCETRPAMIIRSDCRGEGRNTSAPKRAMSSRDAPIDIISIAQQARPKVFVQSGEDDAVRLGITDRNLAHFGRVLFAAYEIVETSLAVHCFYFTALHEF